MSSQGDAAGIGGRSVSVATPTESSTQVVSNPTAKTDFSKLSEEEKQILLQQALAAEGLAEAPRITNPETGRDFPFGATLSALKDRKNFRNALSALFLKPVNTEGIPVNEKQARVEDINFRLAVLDEKQKLNPFQKKINDLAKTGKRTFAGDALDIARSNFTRQVNNEKATLKAESLILRSELGDKDARNQIRISEFDAATKSFSEGGGAETLGGDRLRRGFEIFTPKENITPTEQQQVADIDQQIAQLDARLRGGYTKDTGRARRVAGYFGNGRPFFGNEADHWANGLGQKREALQNQKSRIVNDVRPATIDERRIKGAGLSRTTGKPASLFAVLSTKRVTLGLPQFNGDRGSAPGLKAQVQQGQKIQADRIRSENAAVKRISDIKSIEADNTLTRREKAKAIQALRKPDNITNEQFEASRAGFAAQAVNLPSSVTTRSVQEFIDIGRRLRERLASG